MERDSSGFRELGFSLALSLLVTDVRPKLPQIASVASVASVVAVVVVVGGL